MRYATFSTARKPSPRLGVVRGDHIVDVAAAGGGSVPDTLSALIEGGADAERRIRDLLDRSAGERAAHPLAEVRWHSPIPRPSKNIVCLGLNYAAHARESSQARGRETRIPTVPVFFTKAPGTMHAPFDDVVVDPGVTSQVDWEVELGIILGAGGRDITSDTALAHVFGYTVINDLSARDLQSQHLQWFKGKSLDGFCPMGPVVVSADEFGDPQQKRLQSRVNGVTKQDASTADMIFPVHQIIEWLSRGMTLEPGDIIATGTPEGVGMGRTPPEFLKDGDVVEAEVEGVGILRNRIVTRVRA
jgi:2-keto-4-pentenoate hydratase/2-oxohepta-3-ene-1,7-dioic acid hydratase in catechol pathway